MFSGYKDATSCYNNQSLFENRSQASFVPGDTSKQSGSPWDYTQQPFNTVPCYTGDQNMNHRHSSGLHNSQVLPQFENNNVLAHYKNINTSSNNHQSVVRPRAVINCQSNCNACYNHSVARIPHHWNASPADAVRYVAGNSAAPLPSDEISRFAPNIASFTQHEDANHHLTSGFATHLTKLSRYTKDPSLGVSSAAASSKKDVASPSEECSVLSHQHPTRVESMQEKYISSLSSENSSTKKDACVTCRGACRRSNCKVYQQQTLKFPGLEPIPIQQYGVPRENVVRYTGHSAPTISGNNASCNQWHQPPGLWLQNGRPPGLWMPPPDDIHNMGNTGMANFWTDRNNCEISGQQLPPPPNYHEVTSNKPTRSQQQQQQHKGGTSLHDGERSDKLHNSMAQRFQKIGDMPQRYSEMLMRRKAPEDMVSTENSLRYQEQTPQTRSQQQQQQEALVDCSLSQDVQYQTQVLRSLPVSQGSKDDRGHCEPVSTVTELCHPDISRSNITSNGVNTGSAIPNFTSPGELHTDLTNQLQRDTARKYPPSNTTNFSSYPTHEAKVPPSSSSYSAVLGIAQPPSRYSSNLTYTQSKISRSNNYMRLFPENCVEDSYNPHSSDGVRNSFVSSSSNNSNPIGNMLPTAGMPHQHIPYHKEVPSAGMNCSLQLQPSNTSLGTESIIRYGNMKDPNEVSTAVTSATTQVSPHLQSCGRLSSENAPPYLCGSATMQVVESNPACSMGTSVGLNMDPKHLNNSFMSTSHKRESVVAGTQHAPYQNVLTGTGSENLSACNMFCGQAPGSSLHPVPFGRCDDSNKNYSDIHVTGAKVGVISRSSKENCHLSSSGIYLQNHSSALPLHPGYNDCKPHLLPLMEDAGTSRPIKKRKPRTKGVTKPEQLQMMGRCWEQSRNNLQMTSAPVLDVRQFLATWDEETDDLSPAPRLPDVVLSNSSAENPLLVLDCRNVNNNGVATLSTVDRNSLLEGGDPGNLIHMYQQQIVSPSASSTASNDATKIENSVLTRNSSNGGPQPLGECPSLIPIDEDKVEKLDSPTTYPQSLEGSGQRITAEKHEQSFYRTEECRQPLLKHGGRDSANKSDIVDSLIENSNLLPENSVISSLNNENGISNMYKKSDFTDSSACQDCHTSTEALQSRLDHFSEDAGHSYQEMNIKSTNVSENQNTEGLDLQNVNLNQEQNNSHAYKEKHNSRRLEAFNPNQNMSSPCNEMTSSSHMFEKKYVSNSDVRHNRITNFEHKNELAMMPLNHQTVIHTLKALCTSVIERTTHIQQTDKIKLLNNTVPAADTKLCVAKTVIEEKIEQLEDKCNSDFSSNEDNADIPAAGDSSLNSASKTVTNSSEDYSCKDFNVCALELPSLPDKCSTSQISGENSLDKTSNEKTSCKEKDTLRGHKRSKRRRKNRAPRSVLAEMKRYKRKESDSDCKTDNTNFQLEADYSSDGVSSHLSPCCDKGVEESPDTHFFENKIHPVIVDIEQTNRSLENKPIDTVASIPLPEKSSDLINVKPLTDGEALSSSNNDNNNNNNNSDPEGSECAETDNSQLNMSVEKVSPYNSDIGEDLDMSVTSSIPTTPVSGGDGDEDLDDDVLDVAPEVSDILQEEISCSDSESDLKSAMVLQSANPKEVYVHEGVHIPKESTGVTSEEEEADEDYTLSDHSGDESGYSRDEAQVVEEPHKLNIENVTSTVMEEDRREHICSRSPSNKDTADDQLSPGTDNVINENEFDELKLSENTVNLPTCSHLIDSKCSEDAHAPSEMQKLDSKPCQELEIDQNSTSRQTTPFNVNEVETSLTAETSKNVLKSSNDSDSEIRITDKEANNNQYSESSTFKEIDSKIEKSTRDISSKEDNDISCVKDSSDKFLVEKSINSINEAEREPDFNCSEKCESSLNSGHGNKITSHIFRNETSQSFVSCHKLSVDHDKILNNDNVEELLPNERLTNSGIPNSNVKNVSSDKLKPKIVSVSSDANCVETCDSRVDNVVSSPSLPVMSGSPVSSERNEVDSICQHDDTTAEVDNPLHTEQVSVEKSLNEEFEKNSDEIVTAGGSKKSQNKVKCNESQKSPVLKNIRSLVCLENKKDCIQNAADINKMTETDRSENSLLLHNDVMEEELDSTIAKKEGISECHSASSDKGVQDSDNDEVCIKSDGNMENPNSCLSESHEQCKHSSFNEQTCVLEETDVTSCDEDERECETQSKIKNPKNSVLPSFSSEYHTDNVDQSANSDLFINKSLLEYSEKEYERVRTVNRLSPNKTFDQDMIIEKYKPPQFLDDTVLTEPINLFKRSSSDNSSEEELVKNVYESPLNAESQDTKLLQENTKIEKVSERENNVSVVVTNNVNREDSFATASDEETDFGTSHSNDRLNEEKCVNLAISTNKNNTSVPFDNCDVTFNDENECRDIETDIVDDSEVSSTCPANVDANNTDTSSVEENNGAILVDDNFVIDSAVLATEIDNTCLDKDLSCTDPVSNVIDSEDPGDVDMLNVTHVVDTGNIEVDIYHHDIENNVTYLDSDIVPGKVDDMDGSFTVFNRTIKKSRAKIVDNDVANIRSGTEPDCEEEDVESASVCDDSDADPGDSTACSFDNNEDIALDGNAFSAAGSDGGSDDNGDNINDDDNDNDNDVCNKLKISCTTAKITTVTIHSTKHSESDNIDDNVIVENEKCLLKHSCTDPCGCKQINLHPIDGIEKYETLMKKASEMSQMNCSQDMGQNITQSEIPYSDIDKGTNSLFSTTTSSESVKQVYKASSIQEGIMKISDCNLDIHNPVTTKERKKKQLTQENELIQESVDKNNCDTFENEVVPDFDCAYHQSDLPAVADLEHKNLACESIEEYEEKNHEGKNHATSEVHSKSLQQGEKLDGDDIENSEENVKSLLKRDVPPIISVDCELNAIENTPKDIRSSLSQIVISDSSYESEPAKDMSITKPVTGVVQNFELDMPEDLSGDTNSPLIAFDKNKSSNCELKIPKNISEDINSSIKESDKDIVNDGKLNTMKDLSEDISLPPSESVVDEKSSCELNIAKYVSEDINSPITESHVDKMNILRSASDDINSSLIESDGDNLSNYESHTTKGFSEDINSPLTEFDREKLSNCLLNIPKDVSENRNSSVNESDEEKLSTCELNMCKDVSEDVTSSLTKSVMDGAINSELNIPKDVSKDIGSPETESDREKLNICELNMSKSVSEDINLPLTESTVDEANNSELNVPKDVSEDVRLPVTESDGEKLNTCGINMSKSVSEDINLPLTESTVDEANNSELNVPKDVSEDVSSPVTESDGEKLNACGIIMSKDVSEHINSPLAESGVDETKNSELNIPEDVSEGINSPVTESDGEKLNTCGINMSKDVSEHINSPLAESGVDEAKNSKLNIPEDVSEGINLPVTESDGEKLSTCELNMPKDLSKDTNSHLSESSMDKANRSELNIPKDASENTNTPLTEFGVDEVNNFDLNIPKYVSESMNSPITESEGEKLSTCELNMSKNVSENIYSALTVVELNNSELNIPKDVSEVIYSPQTESDGEKLRNCELNVKNMSENINSPLIEYSGEKLTNCEANISKDVPGNIKLTLTESDGEKLSNAELNIPKDVSEDINSSLSEDDEEKLNDSEGLSEIISSSITESDGKKLRNCELNIKNVSEDINSPLIEYNGENLNKCDVNIPKYVSGDINSTLVESDEDNVSTCELNIPKNVSGDISSPLAEYDGKNVSNCEINTPDEVSEDVNILLTKSDVIKISESGLKAPKDISEVNSFFTDPNGDNLISCELNISKDVSEIVNSPLTESNVDKRNDCELNIPNDISENINSSLTESNVGKVTGCELNISNNISEDINSPLTESSVVKGNDCELNIPNYISENINSSLTESNVGKVTDYELNISNDISEDINAPLTESSIVKRNDCELNIPNHIPENINSSLTESNVGKVTDCELNISSDISEDINSTLTESSVVKGNDCELNIPNHIPENINSSLTESNVAKVTDCELNISNDISEDINSTLTESSAVKGNDCELNIPNHIPENINSSLTESNVVKVTDCELNISDDISEDINSTLTESSVVKGNDCELNISNDVSENINSPLTESNLDKRNDCELNIHNDISENSSLTESNVDKRSDSELDIPNDISENINSPLSEFNLDKRNECELNIANDISENTNSSITESNVDGRSDYELDIPNDISENINSSLVECNMDKVTDCELSISNDISENINSSLTESNLDKRNDCELNIPNKISENINSPLTECNMDKVTDCELSISNDRSISENINSPLSESNVDKRNDCELNIPNDLSENINSPLAECNMAKVTVCELSISSDASENIYSPQIESNVDKVNDRELIVSKNVSDDTNSCTLENEVNQLSKLNDEINIPEGVSEEINSSVTESDMDEISSCELDITRNVPKDNNSPLTQSDVDKISICQLHISRNINSHLTEDAVENADSVVVLKRSTEVNISESKEFNSQKFLCTEETVKDEMCNSEIFARTCKSPIESTKNESILGKTLGQKEFLLPVELGTKEVRKSEVREPINETHMSHVLQGYQSPKECEKSMASSSETEVSEYSDTKHKNASFLENNESNSAKECIAFKDNQAQDSATNIDSNVSHLEGVLNSPQSPQECNYFETGSSGETDDMPHLEIINTEVSPNSSDSLEMPCLELITDNVERVKDIEDRFVPLCGISSSQASTEMEYSTNECVTHRKESTSASTLECELKNEDSFELKVTPEQSTALLQNKSEPLSLPTDDSPVLTINIPVMETSLSSGCTVNLREESLINVTSSEEHDMSARQNTDISTQMPIDDVACEETVEVSTDASQQEIMTEEFDLNESVEPGQECEIQEVPVSPETLQALSKYLDSGVSSVQVVEVNPEDMEVLQSNLSGEWESFQLVTSAEECVSMNSEKYEHNPEHNTVTNGGEIVLSADKGKENTNIDSNLSVSRTDCNIFLYSNSSDAEIKESAVLSSKVDENVNSATSTDSTVPCSELLPNLDPNLREVLPVDSVSNWPYLEEEVLSEFPAPDTDSNNVASSSISSTPSTHSPVPASCSDTVQSDSFSRAGSSTECEISSSAIHIQNDSVQSDSVVMSGLKCRLSWKKIFDLSKAENAMKQKGDFDCKQRVTKENDKSCLKTDQQSKTDFEISSANEFMNKNGLEPTDKCRKLSGNTKSQQTRILEFRKRKLDGLELGPAKIEVRLTPTPPPKGVPKTWQVVDAPKSERISTQSKSNDTESVKKNNTADINSASECASNTPSVVTQLPIVLVKRLILKRRCDEDIDIESDKKRKNLPNSNSSSVICANNIDTSSSADGKETTCGTYKETIVGHEKVENSKSLKESNASSEKLDLNTSPLDKQDVACSKGDINSSKSEEEEEEEAGSSHISDKINNVESDVTENDADKLNNCSSVSDTEVIRNTNIENKAVDVCINENKSCNTVFDADGNSNSAFSEFDSSNSTASENSKQLLPRVIIKRTVGMGNTNNYQSFLRSASSSSNTADRWQPVVRLERDPSLDSLAKILVSNGDTVRRTDRKLRHGLRISLKSPPVQPLVTLVPLSSLVSTSTPRNRTHSESSYNRCQRGRCKRQQSRTFLSRINLRRSSLNNNWNSQRLVKKSSPTPETLSTQPELCFDSPQPNNTHLPNSESQSPSIKLTFFNNCNKVQSNNKDEESALTSDANKDEYSAVESSSKVFENDEYVVVENKNHTKDNLTKITFQRNKRKEVSFAKNLKRKIMKVRNNVSELNMPAFLNQDDKRSTSVSTVVECDASNTGLEIPCDVDTTQEDGSKQLPPELETSSKDESRSLKKSMSSSSYSSCDTTDCSQDPPVFDTSESTVSVECSECESLKSDTMSHSETLSKTHSTKKTSGKICLGNSRLKKRRYVENMYQEDVFPLFQPDRILSVSKRRRSNLKQESSHFDRQSSEEGIQNLTSHSSMNTFGNNLNEMLSNDLSEDTVSKTDTVQNDAKMKINFDENSLDRSKSSREDIHKGVIEESVKHSQLFPSDTSIASDSTEIESDGITENGRKSQGVFSDLKIDEYSETQKDAAANEKDDSCQACGHTYRNQDERTAHIRRHPYHCQRCHLAFRSEVDFVGHLSEQHPRTRERHHCLLCERSFPTAERHKLHLAGRTHRHLELTQRRTIHTLFSIFTGHNCPVLAPLTDSELAGLNWFPVEPGTIHFYHQATPLQRAVQDLLLKKKGDCSTAASVVTRRNLRTLEDEASRSSDPP
ncbi:uncharacterized protein [Periplaneta americana]|uniref:uncharacterized protein n=1 Tax=Periplaneta americana TaxID=6978 RepID=UPI0037E82A66